MARSKLKSFPNGRTICTCICGFCVALLAFLFFQRREARTSSTAHSSERIRSPISHGYTALSDTSNEALNLSLSADQQDNPQDRDGYQFPFRVPENPGSMTYADMEWCPGSFEPPPEAVPSVDPGIRALFVIGAQKAGTTWLHHALSTHTSVVYGVTRIEKKQHKKKPHKELQFFNTWPARSTAEFLSMWPQEELDAMKAGTSQKFLFDASPEYLLNAVVPPRMKQMVPQAKIMIVLRDPTDRAFSAWSMNADWSFICNEPDSPRRGLCVERSFKDTFTTWQDSLESPECRFTTPGANVSWGSCFRCRYNLFRYLKCFEQQKTNPELFPCEGERRGFSVFDYSSYAVQIAWWLEFFPPEQIYIVTADMLKDKQKRLKILDDLLVFVGVPLAPKFDMWKVNSATSFNGNYTSVSDVDEAAKDVVRRFHRPHVQDLRALMDRFFPYVDLSGFPE